MDNIINDHIFNATQKDFVATALQAFVMQYRHCSIFNQWISSTKASKSPSSIQECTFLPISFFKTQTVSCKPSEKPSLIFTSSGTTGMAASRHIVYEPLWYQKAFTQGWQYFFGNPADYAFFCLLPSYMERTGSSLIYMMENLVALNADRLGGFYLHHKSKLIGDLANAQAKGYTIVLMGVSFALLDFAESNPTLIDGMVMETGGMKGRKKEITRQELHEALCKGFGVKSIASEYGMTELMSQAYALENGLFRCPPWMRVLVRDEADPGKVSTTGSGLLCIIDLANRDSCSFIETQDVGRVYQDGSFEVLGRMDTADLRGCNLLIA